MSEKTISAATFPKSMSVDALMAERWASVKFPSPNRPLTPTTEASESTPMKKCAKSLDAIDCMLQIRPADPSPNADTFIADNIDSEQSTESPIRARLLITRDDPVTVEDTATPKDQIEIDSSPEARHSLLLRLRNDVRMSTAQYSRIRALRRRCEKARQASERREAVVAAISKEREEEQRLLAKRQAERLEAACERRRKLAEKRKTKVSSPKSNPEGAPSAAGELVSFQRRDLTASTSSPATAQVPQQCALCQPFVEPCSTLSSLLEATEVAILYSSKLGEDDDTATPEEGDIMRMRIQSTVNELQGIIMTDPFASCTRCGEKEPKKRTCPANVTCRHFQLLPTAALTLLDQTNVVMEKVGANVKNHPEMARVAQFVTCSEEKRAEAARVLVMSHYAVLDGLLSGTVNAMELRLVKNLATLIRHVTTGSGKEQVFKALFETIVSWESVCQQNDSMRAQRSAELLDGVRNTYVSMRRAEIARKKDLAAKTAQAEALEEQLRCAESNTETEAANDAEGESEDASTIPVMTKSQREAQLARLKGRNALLKNKRAGLSLAIGREIEKLRRQLRHLGGDRALAEADALVEAEP